MGGPVGALRGITVDVSDLDRGEAFWGGVFGVGAGRRHEQYVWFDEIAPGVRLILQQVPDEKIVKNRTHLDVDAADPEGLIARVEDLGGHWVGDVEEDDYSLTVLADPDGNEFCVLRRLSAGLAPAAGLASWKQMEERR